MPTLYDLGLGLLNEQTHGRIIPDHQMLHENSYANIHDHVYSTSRWYRLGRLTKRVIVCIHGWIVTIGANINKHILGESR